MDASWLPVAQAMGALMAAIQREADAHLQHLRWVVEARRVNRAAQVRPLTRACLGHPIQPPGSLPMRAWSRAMTPLCRLAPCPLQKAGDAAAGSEEARLQQLGRMGLRPLNDLVAEYRSLALRFDCYQVRGGGGGGCAGWRCSSWQGAA